MSGAIRDVPLVAIVIPTYKAASYIEQTLASVMRAVETSGNISRVYLADDASGDGTVEKAQSFWTSTVPLVVSVNSKNLGECANVNKTFACLAQDNVEWALLLHADDQLHRTWPGLAAQLALEADSRCGIVTCSYTYALTNGDLWTLQNDAPSQPAPKRWFAGVKGSIDIVGKEWFWNVTGSLIKVAAYLDIGGFHPEVGFAGDNDFIIRFFLGGHGVCVVDHPYVVKRGHEGSATSGQMRTGEFAVGWAHLMHRYLWLADKRDRSRSFRRSIYSAMREAIRCVRRGDWRSARGQLRAIFIFVRSWAALLSGWPWLNPASVRVALARRFPYQERSGLG